MGKNAIFVIVIAMRIAILVLHDVFDLGLAALLDAFQTANELAEMSELAVPRFETRVVGVRRAVRTSHGLRVPVHAVGRWRPDCAIVPAGSPILLCNPGTEPAIAHVVIRAGFTATMADGTVLGTPPWAQ